VNQSTLRYGGLVYGVVAVGAATGFGFVGFGEPWIVGTVLAAGATLTAGSVESVVVGPFELGWRGWYAGGVCLLAATAVATPVWQTSVGGFADAEALLFLVTQSIVGLCLLVHAWLVVRRPETLDLTENVDRVIRLPR
jgi:hypothetical protein